jgi:hypothetical protein
MGEQKDIAVGETSVADVLLPIRVHRLQSFHVGRIVASIDVPALLVWRR